MKKFLKEIEDNICGLLLLAMMVLTCINVFARYVFKSSMPFVEELTALGLVDNQPERRCCGSQKRRPSGADGVDRFAA